MSDADFDEEYMDLMVVKGKTMVAAHKNMAYDLKKKLYRFRCFSTATGVFNPGVQRRGTSTSTSQLSSIFHGGSLMTTK
jgi:hypothetical protein